MAPRRRSGGEEGEAACRGRCGGGSASPANSDSARRSLLIGLRASARAEIREKLDFDVHEPRGRALLAAGAPAVFQAPLRAEGLAAVADILERRDGAWFVHEVKASTRHRAIFDYDLAFQWVVMELAGFPVAGAGVICLDPTYVHPGSEVDPERLLLREDRTVEVRALLGQVRREIEQQRAVLARPDMPAASPWRHCRGDRKSAAGDRPSDCGHLEREGICGRMLPEHWALRLPGLRGGGKEALVRQPPGDDIRNLDPDDAGPGWTPRQAGVIRAHRDGVERVDRGALRSALAHLEWPLCFVDFEFDPGVAVPRFEGMGPYHPLPFQWAGAVQLDPGGPIEELEPFLHERPDDPREPFLRSLLRALPETGPVVVYNAGAESAVLRHYDRRSAAAVWPSAASAGDGPLRRFIPWLDGRLAGEAGALRARLFDLLPVAREAYYHPGMRCSWSLKKLAPALLGAAYEDLAIQDGLEAVRRWRVLVAEETGASERRRRRDDLLAYCSRDAVLMHRILERFRAFAA